MYPPIIQMTNKEFIECVAQAYSDSYQKGHSETKKDYGINEDIISEQEALQLLQCGKSIQQQKKY